MAARNQAWYDANANRAYPLDDGASLLTDAGELMPDHILTDLQVRFPRSAAQCAFIGSVTVTANITTITILGAPSPAVPTEDPAFDTEYVPLAAVTVVRPIVGRHYPLEALYPGVGGWVVFGPGVKEPFTGRFNDVTQSAIIPSAARSYQDLPIADAGLFGTANPLTGLITLSGGTDIEVVAECRTTPVAMPGAACGEGDSRTVIVFRLKNTDLDRSRNVFDIYRGPCSGRPESQTCGDPQPIEFINTVGPDCCGRLILEFTGCARITPIAAPYAGIVVDCSLGLADVCLTPNRLPDADGFLPNDYTDLCSDYSEIL